MLWLRWGLFGAALSTLSTLAGRFIFAHFLIKRDAKMNAAYSLPFTSQVWDNIWSQFIFCLKGAPMGVLPFWASDIFVGLASYTGELQLAA